MLAFSVFVCVVATVAPNILLFGFNLCSKYSICGREVGIACNTDFKTFITSFMYSLVSISFVSFVSTATYK